MVRYAIISFSFGFRFEATGYLLTDARTHRGVSACASYRGSPGLIRPSPRFPGGSSASIPLRVDVKSRKVDEADALGVGTVGYVDILLTATER